MKLLFCPECTDIFSLSTKGEKRCSCGKTSGRYINNLDAVYEGGLPIGISNPDFISAIKISNFNNSNNPNRPRGKTFEAWVCPIGISTFTKINKN